MILTQLPLCCNVFESALAGSILLDLNIWGALAVSPAPARVIEAPYLIVYRINAERREIEILAVFHGRQERE